MNADAPLYQRDPEAWQTHLAEGNAKQPRKRVSADVLLRDHAGRILLVDPIYKPDWDTPGGMAEANEPPHQAVRRELKEELDLDIQVGSLLVVDWVSPLAFMFDGGELSVEQITELKIMDDELTAFEFCTHPNRPNNGFGRMSGGGWRSRLMR